MEADRTLWYLILDTMHVAKTARSEVAGHVVEHLAGVLVPRPKMRSSGWWPGGPRARFHRLAETMSRGRTSEALHLGAEHGHRALERAPVCFRPGLVAVDTPIESRRPSDHAPGEPEASRQYGTDDGEGFSVHGPELGALSERPPVEPAGRPCGA